MSSPALVRLLTRRRLPAGMARWRARLLPGEERAALAGEWEGALVMVECGAIEVRCVAGARRVFGSGDVLALDWLGVRALRNVGLEEASLIAVRRRLA